MLIGVN